MRAAAECRLAEAALMAFSPGALLAPEGQVGRLQAYNYVSLLEDQAWHVWC